MFLPHFDVFCDLLLNQTHGNIYLFYNNNEKPFFISKYFKITRKPAFCPAFARLCTKKAIWRDLFIQNEAISLVALPSMVEKNRATVKSDSSAAPRWMKTYSQSRIELQNLQILKKMLEKSSQFLSSE